MIHRITLIVIAICLSLNLRAQPGGISKSRPDLCAEIAYSSSVAFTGFMKDLQYDSAREVLQYWESKCGLREPVFRAEVILALATAGDVDSLVNKESLVFLRSFAHRFEMIRSRNFSDYDYNQAYFGFVPIGQEFDSFTIDFFEAVHSTHKPGTTAFLLCEAYRGNADTIYGAIQTEEYGETGLAREYYKLVNRYLRRPETNMALVAGIWVPTGGITRLGTHPDIGCQLGAKYRRINIDLTITFKFMRSQKPYYATRVRSDQSVVLTDKFFGGYFGIDGGYDIWRNGRQEVHALFGAGLDGFDAIEEDTIRQLKAESTWTYNFNFGVGYRFYIDNSAYIGLRAKYNIVDYSLRGVVDFTGNPITIQFVIGGLFNRVKRDALESLHYKWRYRPRRPSIYKEPYYFQTW